MIQHADAHAQISKTLKDVERMRGMLSSAATVNNGIGSSGVDRSIEMEIKKRLESLERNDAQIQNIHEYISQNVSDFGFDPPLPDEPTDHPAGSKEKIEIMIQRVNDGMAIFHPDDRKISDGLPKGTNVDPYPITKFQFLKRR